jgi:fatty-acyl-CoA synthase
MEERDSSVRGVHDYRASERMSSAGRQSIHSTYELIQAAAMQEPERTALAVLEDHKQSAGVVYLSNRALLNAIHQVANLLADLGIEAKDVIAILLPQLLETHLVLWGGQAAGIVCPISPRLPAKHIVAQLQVAQAKVLVAPGPEVSQQVWQKAMLVRQEVEGITHMLQVRGLGNERDGVYAFNALLADYPSDHLCTKRVIASDDIAISIPMRNTSGVLSLKSLTHIHLLDAAWVLGYILNLTPTEVLLQGLLRFTQVWW